MIIKSKLAVPDKAGLGIVRQRLFPNSKPYKLGLICAPAGYGKTTAIVDWASTNSQLAWFKIDSFDDNISQFYTYFVHAISQLETLSCPASIEAIKHYQFPDLINLFTLLINELSEYRQPTALVLDNYQHIKNPVIHQGLTFFIKNMPDNWQVIISSRTPPPLAVSSLRIKQQLFEIGEKELAFTLSETEEFFSSSTHFERDAKVQEALCQAVDGWPVALQLVSILSTDSASFKECAEQISNSRHAYLWDYLDEEVFSTLNAKFQSLLLAIAPLNKMDGDIVNELCNIEDGHAQLASLQAQGAFIVTSNHQQQWFTLHSFFRAFLIHKSSHSKDIQHTHKRIAQLWLKRGDIEEALPHALISEDKQLLIDLLLETGWQLFNNGQLNSLGEYLELIEDEIWSYPKLVLLKAWMLLNQHQSERVVELVTTAHVAFNKLAITLSQQQKDEFSIIQAQLAINRGNVKEALAQAEKNIATADKNTPRVNIVAQTIIGEAHHYMGNLSLAYQYFQKVKQLADTQNLQQSVIWSLYQQAEILQAQNNHVNAERHIDAAISLINKHQFQKLPLYTYLLHFKAQQAYQKADFKLADYLCKHALEIILPYGEDRCLTTHTLQAKIAFAKDQREVTTQLISEIEKPLHNLRDYNHWHTSSDYVRLLYWQENQDVHSVSTWLNENPPVTPAYNRFDQCHNRNRIRAFIGLGKLQKAQILLDENIKDAQHCDLKTEINYNLILLSSLNAQLKEMNQAATYLHQAIEYSLQTGLVMSFVSEVSTLKTVYQLLTKDPALNNRVKEKLDYLLSLSGISLQRAPKMPFDLISTNKIQAHTNAPRLIKNIPLTPREWQVFGYIHSGYRNQQIASAMNIAPTTVKSHIRNLYQKLGLENREEALQLSATLISLLE